MYLFDLIKNNEKDLLSTTCVDFYFITPPGSEGLLIKEIQSYGAEINPIVDKGGVCCKLPLGLGLALNKVLKIPVRVLLRLASFKARDLPKFYKKISSLNWGKIIFDQPIIAHITTSKCRLIQTEKLSKSFLDAINEHRRKNPPKKSSFIDEQRVWILSLIHISEPTRPY